MSDIAHVKGDYWAGLYLNGKLIREDHTVSLDDFATVFLTNQPINSFRTIYACLDWLDDIGNLPDNLEDVKERDY